MMTPQQLTDEIGDVLHIVDVDGTMYATDTYWLAPIPADVIGLLRWWNLEPTPGRYEFDYLDLDSDDECTHDPGRGPLRRRGEPTTAEKLAAIMDKLAGNPLERLCTESGQTLYVLNKRTDKPLAVFKGTEDDGSTFYVAANPHYMRLAFGDWESVSVELRCPNPRSPIWAPDVHPLACVMPVLL